MFDRELEAELTQRYEDLSDDRLARLAAKPEELTDLARDLVTEEVRRRGGVVTEAPAKLSPTGFDGAYTGDPDIPRGERKLWCKQPGDYVKLAPPDCVFSVSERDNWHAIRVSLALAGIPRDEFWPSEKTDLRGPMIAVLPEDRDRAKAILAAPVSEQVKVQMQEELDDPVDWQPPCCPRCGEPDALLTSVKPVNQWQCDVCGHTWMDTSEQVSAPQKSLSHPYVQEM